MKQRTNSQRIHSKKATSAEFAMLSQIINPSIQYERFNGNKADLVRAMDGRVILSPVVKNLPSTVTEKRHWVVNQAAAAVRGVIEVEASNHAHFAGWVCYKEISHEDQLKKHEQVIKVRVSASCPAPTIDKPSISDLAEKSPEEIVNVLKDEIGLDLLSRRLGDVLEHIE